MALKDKKCFTPSHSAKAGSGPPSSTAKIPNTEKTGNRNYNKFSALEDLEDDSQSDPKPTLPPKGSDEWESAFPDTPLGPQPTKSSNKPSNEPRFPKASMKKKEKLELDNLSTRKPISNTYEIIPSDDHQKKHWDAPLSYGEYTLELRRKPEGEAELFPPNAILLFAKEPKEIVHKRGSMYQSFLNKNWRVLLRNHSVKEGEAIKKTIANPEKKIPNPKQKIPKPKAMDEQKRINPLNWGLCLDTYGALVDPKNAEVIVSKHGRPLGVREALQEAPQEAPSELSQKKPLGWLHRTLPFSVKTYHPTMWEGLTYKDKQDPAYLYEMLKKANQAVTESMETFRSDAWKLTKLRENQANILMSQEHVIKENEKLQAALVDMQTELALTKAEHEFHNKSSVTRERVRTYEKNQREIKTLLEENLKKLSEISREGAESVADQFADNLEKLVAMQTEMKWPRKLTTEDQILAADRIEAKKTFNRIAVHAGKDIQERLADARVARIEYRNGLIEGQHSARANRSQDDIEAHEHLVKTETERLLNNAFLHQYKTDSDNLIAFGERRGFARGFATGMNTMSQLENNTYNLAEDDPSHWKSLAQQAGALATEVSVFDEAQFRSGGLWHGTNMPGRINSLIPTGNDTQPAHLKNFFEYTMQGISNNTTNPAVNPDPQSQFKLPYYIASLPWQHEYVRTVSDAIRDINKKEQPAKQKMPKSAKKPKPEHGPGPESTSGLGQPDNTWFDMKPFTETTALLGSETEAGPNSYSAWDWEDYGPFDITDDFHEGFTKDDSWNYTLNLTKHTEEAEPEPEHDFEPMNETGFDLGFDPKLEREYESEFEPAPELEFQPELERELEFDSDSEPEISGQHKKPYQAFVSEDD